MIIPTMAVTITITIAYLDTIYIRYSAFKIHGSMLKKTTMQILKRQIQAHTHTHTEIKVSSSGFPLLCFTLMQP